MKLLTSVLLSLTATGVMFPAAAAIPHSITIKTPDPPASEGFRMGESQSPGGDRITLDSRSLLLNGQPWTPVMGEFHFSRYPADEWREELLKMKAGGIDIVATYVFWIHHEEIEGEWDWSGRRDLRRFIQTAGGVGLKSVVRCGPWCHGEVRNGGTPDWVLAKGWRNRSNDERYLEKARRLYGQIATQLRGLLWKDGGPVIGIQLDNEYRGPAEHLLALKRIAREVGLDVPLYTRTGWPSLTSPMPFGEIAPLYGVYAEGFWDRELTPMPGRYWSGFHFSTMRTDSNIANELLGRSEARDAPDVARYPYLTCEIGGGMMSSYHRRIYVYPEDVESTTLIKIGSGSTSPGYYMYHGGVNPEGKLTTLMESQATGMWNDMPVRNYDFQTALGQYGQIRPQYHLLRRLHLFLHEWGPALARMPTSLPDQRPSGKDDENTLRWCVRSDGKSGFVFVNNYQRLKTLPPKQDVQFKLNLPDGELLFPDSPVTIPANRCFIWPFHFDLGHGVQLAWATAQPLCAVDDAEARTLFFARTPGIRPEFAFSTNGPRVRAFGDPMPRGNLSVVRDTAHAGRDGRHLLVDRIRTGTDVAMTLDAPDGTRLRIVLLDEADSTGLWSGRWQGRDRVFLTRAGLVLDGDHARLRSPDRDDLSIGIHPKPAPVIVEDKRLKGVVSGIFTTFTPIKPKEVRDNARFEMIQPAGEPRQVTMGTIRQPVAAAPVDADFDKAAIWRIMIPAGLDLSTDPILRIHYVGDVARMLLDGKLITDDFYNGKPFEVGLRRHAPGILKGELRLAVLPLRRDAPIYLGDEAKPDFGGQESIAVLDRIEIVPRYQVQLTAGPALESRQKSGSAESTSALNATGDAIRN